MPFGKKCVQHRIHTQFTFEIGRVQCNKKRKQISFLNSELVHFILFHRFMCLLLLLLFTASIYLYVVVVFNELYNVRVNARCACKTGDVCENCVYAIWTEKKYVVLPKATNNNNNKKRVK